MKKISEEMIFNLSKKILSILALFGESHLNMIYTPYTFNNRIVSKFSQDFQLIFFVQFSLKFKIRNFFRFGVSYPPN